MRRKRILILFVFLSALMTLPAITISANFGWGMDIRLGIEIPLTESLSIKAEAGSSLFSLEGDFVLCYGLYGIWYATEPISNLKFGLTFGLNDGMFVFNGEKASMHAIGLAGKLNYDFGGGFAANLDLGGGLPLYFEEGRPRLGGDAFLDWFWPCVKLGAKYAFPAPR